MIVGFKDKLTEAVYYGEAPKGFPADLVAVTRRKLRYLNAAGQLNDLKIPPGNHLEALKDDRAGAILHPDQSAIQDLLCLDEQGAGTGGGHRLSLISSRKVFEWPRN